MYITSRYIFYNIQYKDPNISILAIHPIEDPVKTVNSYLECNIQRNLGSK